MDEPLSGEFAPSVARRFVIEAELARGGMGIVYLAYDRELERPIALKRARSDVPNASARLRREATLAGRLVHASILPVYETGLDAEGEWMAMPYLEGRRLDALDRPAALVALVEVARGAGHAHDKGIVHRDLKPSNVLVTDRALVLDWGLAVCVEDGPDARLTQTGVQVGTPGYTAPEQLLGHPPAPTVDVWSLGAMLWGVLSGRPPFAPDTVPSLDQQVLRGQYEPLDGPLGAVANRALDADPSRRFPDGRAFADALQQAMAPTGVGQKRSGLWAGTALIAAALAAGMAWSPQVEPVPSVGDDVRSDHAWMLVRQGRLEEARTLGAPTRSPAWEALPQVSVQVHETWSCDRFQVADGRLLCVGEESAVHDLETREVQPLAPYDGRVGLAPGGLWYEADGRLALQARREGIFQLQARATSVEVGEDVLFVGIGNFAQIIDVEGDKIAEMHPVLELNRPRAAWVHDAFLVFAENAPPQAIDRASQVRVLDFERPEGKVVGIGPMGDHTVVVWDRGPMQWLDRDLELVHSAMLPPDTKVRDVAYLDGFFAVATVRQGVLAFAPSGALLGQITPDEVPDIEGHGDRLFLAREHGVEEVSITHEGPAAWFFDDPVTALAVQDGRVAVGTRDGRVQRLAPDPASIEVSEYLVRRLWWNGEGVRIHALGKKTLLDFGTDGLVVGPPVHGRHVLPFDGGHIMTLWGSGVRKYYTGREPNLTWWSPDLDLVRMEGDDDVVAGVTPEGRVAIGRRGAERLEMLEGAPGTRVAWPLDDGVVVAGDGFVGLLAADGAFAWREPIEGRVTGIVVEDGTCAFGTASGRVEVWSCAGEHRLSLDAHDEAVWRLELDDDALYTAGLDAVVRRWVLR